MMALRFIDVSGEIYFLLAQPFFDFALSRPIKNAYDLAGVSFFSFMDSRNK
jgi:hypothetical protein